MDGHATGALTRAERTLFGLLSENPTPETRQGVRHLERRGWRAVAQRALELQCASLLWQRLQASGMASEAPSDVSTRLARVHAWSRVRNLALFAERDAIAAVLADHGIRVVVLKGADLAHRYDSVGARPIGDLDLLVRASDLGATIRALQSVGYGPSDLPSADAIVAARKMPDLRKPGGFPVDMHWRIKGGGARAAAAIEGVWKRVRPLGPGPCFCLDPVDALLYTSLHLASSHAFGSSNSVAGLADLGILVRDGVDLETAGQRADEWGLRPSLFLSLLLARDLLGVAVPAPFLRTIEREGWEPHVRAAIQRLTHSNPLRDLFFGSRPTLNPAPGSSGLLGVGVQPRTLARYLKRAALPPFDDIAVEFRGLNRGLLPWLAYPLLWAQLSTTHAGLLRRPLYARRLRAMESSQHALRTWLEQDMRTPDQT